MTNVLLYCPSQGEFFDASSLGQKSSALAYTLHGTVAWLGLSLLMGRSPDMHESYFFKKWGADSRTVKHDGDLVKFARSTMATDISEPLLLSLRQFPWARSRVPNPSIGISPDIQVKLIRAQGWKFLESDGGEHPFELAEHLEVLGSGKFLTGAFLPQLVERLSSGIGAEDVKVVSAEVTRGAREITGHCGGTTVGQNLPRSLKMDVEVRGNSKTVEVKLGAKEGTTLSELLDSLDLPLCAYQKKTPHFWG